MINQTSIAMKRTLVLFAALFLSVLMADARTVKKAYDMDGFTGIRASDGFDIVVEKSNEYRVEVEVTEDFLPFLLVKNRGGVLELSFTRLPFKLRQKERSREAQVVIKMPELSGVILSGGCSFSSNDQFSLAMNKFTIDLKGGSSISNLNVKAPDVNIKLSGASRAILNVQSGDVTATLSGASRLEVSGKSSDFRVKAEGASRVLGSEFEVEEATAKASGASTLELRPLQLLTVELSGASKCRYYGNEEGLSVKAEKVSGASSLKHGD